MSKYLVTGGAGFIGSHIVEKLVKEGHFVRVLDNFSSGKEENLNFINNYQLSTINYQLIRGDIRDFSTCLKACKDIDYVIHEAALRSVPKSLKNPYEYNEVNINGTLNILKAALECRVKCVVLASSSSIYGETDTFPEKEEHVPKLISPYALSKLTGEYYCRIFSANYGLATVSLRYFNVFGPRQSLEDEYAVVIPKFITCLLNNQSPPIHGDGRQRRDFTYIDNVVDATLLAANKNPPLCGEVINVAMRKDYSILELASLLNQIMNKDLKPMFTPSRPGDVYRTLADISKAKELLGYQPKVDFQEGLRRTVDWFKKYSTNQ